MNSDLLLPALLVATATVFGVLALVLLWEVVRDGLRRLRARRQLRALAGGTDSEGAAALLRPDVLRERLGARTFGSLPGVASVRTLIRQARVDMAVESFMIMTFACAGGFGFAALIITGSLWPVLPAAALGGFIPYGWLSRERAHRAHVFEEGFPEAIDLLTRAIRAGHPISSGMRMVGDEGPAAVAEEFRIAFEEQRFGLPFEESLLNLVDRNDLVDVRIFVTALLVQRDVGGNLAEILDNLADTIRGRFYIRRQLRVYTAQGRMTGWVLGLLPVIVGSLIWFIEPSYMNVLLGGLGGRALLGAALTLQVIGVLWIRRIVDIEI